MPPSRLMPEVSKRSTHCDSPDPPVDVADCIHGPRCALLRDGPRRWRGGSENGSGLDQHPIGDQQLTFPAATQGRVLTRFPYA